MKHDWRTIIQYRLTDEEARLMVQGYGHPEVDNAPDRLLARGEVPAVGDPRVFLGSHNILRDETLVVCWNCELAWHPEIAKQECHGESELRPGEPSLAEIGPIGNVPGDRLGGIGRNEPCPCGSGKKFKRCHGAN